MIWRRFSNEGHVSETDQPNLNQRTQRYLGRTLTLSEAIVNGVGKVKVDDSQWSNEAVDSAKSGERHSKKVVISIRKRCRIGHHS